MRPLQRFFKTISPKQTFDTDAVSLDFRNCGVMTLQSSVSDKTTDDLLLPVQIHGLYHLQAQSVNQHIVLHNQHYDGRMEEIVLYDNAHILDPEFRQVMEHARIKSIELHLQKMDFHSTLPLSVENPLFVRVFAHQDEAHLYRYMYPFGAEILIQPPGLRETFASCVDLLPYGGFYTPGCSLDECVNYFVQPMLPDPHSDLMLLGTRVQRWREMSCNPFGIHRYPDYTVVSSSYAGQGSVNSLAEDLYQGLFQLNVLLDGRPVGVWQSKDYHYVNRAEEQIEILFIKKEENIK